MNKLMHSVYFNIEKVTPDPREYNQQRQVFIPEFGTRVRVEIEINKENFYVSKKYFEAIKLWELGQGDIPEPQDLAFTPLGWKRVMEQLEEPYRQDEPPWDDDDEFESYYKKEK